MMNINRSKYIEFKQVPFKGKTKRFEVVSKTSLEKCSHCKGGLEELGNGNLIKCDMCNGTGKISIILGRISWYTSWRQYAFSPAYPTVWNKDCLNTITEFIINLMEERNNNDLDNKTDF